MNERRFAGPPDAIIVMGVSGSGKTTVGRQLAARLGWAFVDADDHHPPANVAKMRAGTPLTDDDRAPWLDRLNALLRHRVAKGEPTVLACSALKERYRAALRDRLAASLVLFLDGGFELIEARTQTRQHAYMPSSLLASQFAALEPPQDAWRFDVAADAQAIVDEVLRRLGHD